MKIDSQIQYLTTIATALEKHCRMRKIPVNLRIQAMDLLRKHPPMIYIQMS